MRPDRDRETEELIVIPSFLASLLGFFLKKYLEVQFNYKFVLNIPSVAISQHCIRRYLNIKIFVWLFYADNKHT
jgi:uncharacterized membrane protein YjjP (DUF1212 family)